MYRKSQIAIEYAYQVRDESPSTWAFWVHAGTQARFEEGYRRIAEATKMDGWNDPKADVLRLVRSWLCDETNGRWVMVVDNADDSDVFFPPLHESPASNVSNPGQATGLLSDFLPQSLNGSILVTSRSQDVAFRLTGNYACIVGVKPMDEDDALALLQKKLGFHADRKDATELLQALDRMPLAITQAAAYIAQRAPRVTVSRYLGDIRRSDHDRVRLLKNDVGDSRRDGQASNAIIATWQISFEHIRSEMPTAARLLSLMSLFDRQGIPESLLHDQYQREADTEAHFEDDIHTLTSYSLVEMSADGTEFEMHRLVQYSMKKWLELSDELEAWKETYVALMDNSYPVGRHEHWTVCQALFPHAQAAVDCRPGNAKALEVWASVLFKAAWYASEMGQYDVARYMGAGALEARENILGADHSETLSSMNGIALVLRWQGKYKAAEEMNRRALEGYEKALGKEHPKTLTSVYCLAFLFHQQHRYDDALVLYKRAINGYQHVLGPENSTTVACFEHYLSLVEEMERSL